MNFYCVKLYKLMFCCTLSLMPYMDTIARAILFEVSISLAAPDIQIEKTHIKEQNKIVLGKEILYSPTVS